MILFDPAIIGRDLSGRVVGWSLGAERLLGYCQAEILGASADRLVAPEAREQEAAHLSRVARGDRVAPYTTVRLHKDGRRIPVSVALSSITGPAGEVVAFSEVVRQTEAGREAPASPPSASAGEHSLKRELSEQIRTNPVLFDFLLEGSLDGFWYLDLEHPEAGWLSPRLKEVLGYRDHELPNTAVWWHEIIFPEDLEVVVESFKHHCADPDHPFDQIVRYRHKDGSTVWLRCRGIALRDRAGEPVRMLGAHTDVTAIKNAEERFRAFHDALPDVYVVADRASGAILEHNQVLAECTGYDRAELAGRTFFELCDPQSVPAAEGTFAALASRAILRNVELTLKRKNGSALPVLLTAKATTDAAVRIWCRDISHLQRVANVEVLLEALPNGAILVDEQRLIVAANAVAERFFRSHHEDLLGCSVDLLLPDLWPEATSVSRRGLSASGAIRMLGVGRDLKARRTDGSRFPAQVGLSPIRVREGALTLITVVDTTERKRMEDELRQEKERLATLAASVPGVLYSFRLHPDGKVSLPYASPAVQDIFGLDPSLLAADIETAFAAIHPLDVERVKASIAASARELTPWHDEFRVLHPKKGQIWLEGRSLPSRETDGGVTWHGFATDVTERRLAAQAVTENEARLAGIIGSAMDGIITVDENQRILLFNPAAEKMFGTGADEMLGRPLDRLIPLRLRTAHAEHVRAFGRTGVSQRKMGELGEIWGLHADGTEFPIEASISQIEVAERKIFTVILRDVTERRRAEEELRTSRAQLLAALEAGGMGTWIWEIERDEVSWDDSLLRLWGLTRDDVAGCGFAFAVELVHPEDQEGLRTAIAEVLREGTDVAGEFRVVAAGGTLRHMAYRGRVERDTAGRPLRMTGINIDITAPKRAAEQQLRSQKLEALGTLAGGIAHDFNNILLAITGNTKLVAGDLPPDHPAQETLAEIGKAGKRAAELVRRILAFSRSEDQKREVVPLRPVVEEALHLLRATLPAMIEIRADLGAEGPAVAIDSTQIHQVLVNLATNSAHAIGGRPGLIEIRLDDARIGGGPDGAAANLPAGRYVRLSVSDDGCGMDRETLSRIFDPFFTTKPPGQGTGLGLSLVHSIVESHGGAITVYSEPGRGTTFHLYLPTVEGAAASAPSADPEPRPSRGEHVLYVDDEESLVLLAGRMLKRLGYRVTGCTEPAAALAAFRVDPRSFDAVVTDLSMPGMSGFDLAREILAIRRDVPVVMTSGYFRQEDQETATAIGIRELILKPNTVDELGRALDRLLSAGPLPEAQ